MATRSTTPYSLKFNAGIKASDRNIVERATVQAGQDFWDDRTKHLYQFGRRDVRHAEIVLPRQFAGNERMRWTQHRSLLWNLAEYAEQKPNERVARGYTAELPHSLMHRERQTLVQAFAHTLANRFGSAVDVSLHDAHSQDGNPHAHFLMTARALTLEGFGPISSQGTRQELGELNQRWLGHMVLAMHSAYLQDRNVRIESAQMANHARPRLAAQGQAVLHAQQPSRTGPATTVAPKPHAGRQDDYSR